MDLKVAHVAILSPPVMVLYFGRSRAKSGRGKQSGRTEKFSFYRKNWVTVVILQSRYTIYLYCLL